MRLIDADAFKDYIRGACEDMKHLYKDNGAWAKEITESFCKDIDEQPTIQPNKDKVSNLLYHIYSIQSPHLDMSGVIAKKYYCEELWKELFGKGSELPGWMI